jgi:hypothetical protein
VKTIAVYDFKNFDETTYDPEKCSKGRLWHAEIDFISWSSVISIDFNNYVFSNNNCKEVQLLCSILIMFFSVSTICEGQRDQNAALSSP